MRHRNAVTVAELLEAGKERLGLELASGSIGLSRPIREAAMNRPGFALAGFFQYFAHRRVQVLGHAESAYLASLCRREREDRLRKLLGCRIPCIVVTRNRRVTKEIQRLSEEFGVPVLRTPMITMHFVNAATIIMERLMAPRLIVSGTMVDIRGMGVLIEGKAGVGKSETALALVRRGHCLVSDDVTALRLESTGMVVGSPVGVTRHHMDIRGLGIVHVPSLFGVGSVRNEKELDLIIGLSRVGGGDMVAGFEGVSQTREILGVRIRVIRIPVMPGRDLANLVEAAALDERLKRLGHDAAKELDEKLKAVLVGGARGR